jgi:hypothetical protein
MEIGHALYLSRPFTTYVSQNPAEVCPGEQFLDLAVSVHEANLSCRVTESCGIMERFEARYAGLLTERLQRVRTVATARCSIVQQTGERQV